MNRYLVSLLLPFLLVALSGKTQGPIKVEIRQSGESFELLRDGQPYYINGVGGQKHLDRAVEYGANSLRTWGVDDALKVLDEAHEKGLTVLFGLWVGVERQGFDYNDGKAVKAQLEMFTEVVKAHKDHPAILMWGIGNENDLFYTDFKVWDAINDIAKMIHENDPNHPTMTVTAGIDVAEVQLIRERAPHIDVLGINTYGELIGIDKQIRSFGWDKPYVITEWGPTGHWEVAKTNWDVPIEQTSTEKAASYLERYTKGIAADREKCLGSYVFLWGYKQETTPTWYGVFLEDSTETAVMDELQYVWSGQYPGNRSPQIQALTIDGKKATESIYLQPGRYHTFKVDVTDADGDNLRYRYEILPESTDIKVGGDAESRPEAENLKTRATSTPNTLEFKAPRQVGPYRLFVYVYDGHGNAGVGNVPFYVGTAD